MLVLDSGGLSRLAKRDRQTAALLLALRRRGLWPAVVPTVVLAESLTGSPQRDANVNRLLKACDMRPAVSERMARRAAELRTKSRRGSAVDALVVAIAEPGSTVLSSDGEDLGALAANAADVFIEIV
ncbi:type II toxin-antitoxin system VapC family toxin [Nocardioides speluncae]|uniref:type II toxin-antitoxin system VapC family toxin n=1 Tax=Nocardioides speluncae TaxID=2670337 RepID=UPI000D6994CE|nr:PIN domain-containing protein [Nocardioides speluncae]